MDKSITYRDLEMYLSRCTRLLLHRRASEGHHCSREENIYPREIEELLGRSLNPRGVPAPATLATKALLLPQIIGFALCGPR